MFGTINCVTTRANHWKEQCVGWAEGGQEFMLLAVESYHMTFMQAICLEYDYVMALEHLVGRAVYIFAPSAKVNDPTDRNWEKMTT